MKVCLCYAKTNFFLKKESGNKNRIHKPCCEGDIVKKKLRDLERKSQGSEVQNAKKDVTMLKQRFVRMVGQIK